MSNALGDLTVVVKTFLRPMCLDAAVASIHRHWPDVYEILVLDDSPLGHQVSPDNRFRLLSSEPHIGLSAGRNRLVEATTTPLVAVFDDDFVVSAAMRLDILAEAVAQDVCDLLAPAVREAAGYWNGGWIYEGSPPVLSKMQQARSVEVVQISGLPITIYRVDQVNNAFVARTAFLKKVRWDERLHLKEHDDFALRSSRMGRIAYTPDATVEHCPIDPKPYRRYREDTARFEEVFQRTWGISKIDKSEDWYRHVPEPPHPEVAT